MAKKLKPEEIGDPRVFKKTWLKDVFLNNKEAYEDYLVFWDEAIEKGSTYTYVVAMIEFRRHWTLDAQGYWVRKLVIGDDNE